MAAPGAFREIRVAYEPHGVVIDNLPVRCAPRPTGVTEVVVDALRTLFDAEGRVLRHPPAVTVPCRLRVADGFLSLGPDRWPLDHVESWELTERAVRLWVRVGPRTLRTFDLGHGWPERPRRWLMELLDRARSARPPRPPPPPAPLCRMLEHSGATPWPVRRRGARRSRI